MRVGIIGIGKDYDPKIVAQEIQENFYGITEIVTSCDQTGVYKDARQYARQNKIPLTIQVNSKIPVITKENAIGLHDMAVMLHCDFLLIITRGKNPRLLKRKQWCIDHTLPFVWADLNEMEKYDKNGNKIKKEKKNVVSNVRKGDTKRTRVKSSSNSKNIQRKRNNKPT
jgi:hypothetical protein